MAAIRGHLTDESGLPLAGRTVEFWQLCSEAAADFGGSAGIEPVLVIPGRLEFSALAEEA